MVSLGRTISVCGDQGRGGQKEAATFKKKSFSSKDAGKKIEQDSVAKKGISYRRSPIEDAEGEKKINKGA